MKMLKKFFHLLTKQERKNAVFLLVMILIMALLDALGVASIMPFIAVLATPELLETNVFLKTPYNFSNSLGIKTVEQFLFLLGLLVLVILVSSLAFKAFVTYAQLRFALMREYSVGRRLVEGYLHQPYSWFLSRNSADLGKNILSEVNEVIGGGMIPLMTLIAQSAVAIALLTLVILVDPKLALIVSLTLVTAYALIFKAASGLLSTMWVRSARVIANRARFTAVNEAFGAAKEVKVGRLEQVYIRRFSGPAQIYARNQAAASVISQLPRFAIEALAFGGLLLLVLYLMAQHGSFAYSLPTIALYAFAGYRLMPALQQIYGSLSRLRFSRPSARRPACRPYKPANNASKPQSRGYRSRADHPFEPNSVPLPRRPEVGAEKLEPQYSSQQHSGFCRRLRQWQNHCGGFDPWPARSPRRHARSRRPTHHRLQPKILATHHWLCATADLFSGCLRGCKHCLWRRRKRHRPSRRRACR